MSPLKLPLLLRGSGLPSDTWFHGPTRESTSQTASRSIHPFWHSSCLRPTDGHTDTRRQTELRFSSVRVMRTRLYARQRKIRSISSDRPAGSVFCCCFLFSAIYFKLVISTSTGPIFAKFAVLVKLWLWAVNLKCCFSIPQGTLPWQQVFVGFIHPQNRVPVTFGRWR